jgi:peptide/nickel transport system ATP-binding protein
VQQEILDEIHRLKEEIGFSIIFITHDLSLLLDISDRLAIMYAGEIVEYGHSEQVAARPAHPYTYGLLHSFPELRADRHELRGVPGSPPDLRATIEGCAFTPRCRFAFGPCASTHPELRSPSHTSRLALVPGTGQVIGPDISSQGWSVACHLHDPKLRPAGPPAEIAQPAESSAPAAAAGEDT